MGNSVSRLSNQLQELHGERWYAKYLIFLEHCESYTKLNISLPGISKVPRTPKLPSVKWLMSVYVKDVLQRMEEIKAQITSVFGKVLKLDSTKKVIKT